MTIKDAIRRIAATNDEIYCKICTVDAVYPDTRTIDCTPIDGSAPLLGVNLQANQAGDENADGIVVFPAAESYVLVAFIEESAAAVVLTETIDSIQLAIGKTTAIINDGTIQLAIGETTVSIVDGNITLNGGDNGGLINIVDLTGKLNDFIDAFNNHTHTLGEGAVTTSGGSNIASIEVPKISSEHPTVYVSDYQDTKILH